MAMAAARGATAAARLGPRPLPLHLLTAALTLNGSPSALPLLRSGSLPWKPALASAAARLASELASAPPEAFARALTREIVTRQDAFLDGIEAYRRHPYRRALAEPPVLWSEGGTRLLDYGPPDGAALLVVPSLVNRAYILDLSRDASLLRWLSRQGFRPLLVDWGRPGADERGFTLTDYIAGRLEAALAAALEAAQPPAGKLPVLGYCMGGLLALALALGRAEAVSGLAVLATPWDFHAEGGAVQGQAAARALIGLGPAIDALGELPVDVLQGFFAAIDPLVALKKFTAFARLDPDSAEARTFVALEDWLNDGIPLAAPVARECLAGWYGENRPARGLWRVAGRAVDPSALACPALALVPARDRIVPPASAAALAERLPGAQVLQPPTGHIGMVVGSHARAMAWEPLAAWLKRIV
ncbi:MAG: alpha/beta fold hydrolase [Kiloniellales bacterium]